MAKTKTELEKRNVTRLSNKEANLLTRTCLRHALLGLLESKTLNDITVTELTKKAGVSRTAFYSNYQTINDVLNETIDEYLTRLNDLAWQAINNKEDLFYPIIKELYDHYDIYSLMLKVDIEKTAFFHMRDYIKRTYPNINTETYYLLIATIGMIRNVALEWIISGCKESIETISQICNDASKNLREEILSKI